MFSTLTFVSFVTNLQNLINNLEHQFSVIAVTETCTPEGKKQNLQYDSLEDYQPYYRVKGKNLKRVCGFFVKERLRYKIRKIQIIHNPTMTMCSSAAGLK